MAKYRPVTRLQLIDLVKKVEDLGDIDTSAIDDMRFQGVKLSLNGIISLDKIVKISYNSLVIKI